MQYKLKYNQKNSNDLIIGQAARDFIANKAENHLRDSRLPEFYKNVITYFTTAVDYMLSKLPLNDPVLLHAEVADVKLQVFSNLRDFPFFVDKFPCLLPDGVTKDQLIEQFVSYQSADVQNCYQTRMDETWMCIVKHYPEYRDLAQVMCSILTIPHSSSHCERIFSTVRKNRTDQRACMKDERLDALLVLKSRPGKPLDFVKTYSDMHSKGLITTNRFITYSRTISLQLTSTSVN